MTARWHGAAIGVARTKVAEPMTAIRRRPEEIRNRLWVNVLAHDAQRDTNV